MGYKTAKIRNNTQELLNKCEEEYLRHHPEMKNIPLSKDKIIYEIANFYLKV